MNDLIKNYENIPDEMKKRSVGAYIKSFKETGRTRNFH